MPTSSETPFQSFQQFMESLTGASPEHYLATPANKVSSHEAFTEMKTHLLKHYEGVDVKHSFVDENGQIFDCVPIMQQPSLKGTSQEIATPVDLPGVTGEPKGTMLDLRLSPGRKDVHGNDMHCPDGTIPLRRVTLEELARFESLRDFFQKSPLGGRHPRLGGHQPNIAAGVHKYAHAYQNVNNLGGHSVVNVWDPAVGSQIFSLSQHWYAGGSPVQTAEVGWQVYPGKYGTTKPALFIYWTADGYNKTGNYNLDAAAFVQTSKAYALGGAISPWSTTGGQQYVLDISYYLTGGRWWLYIDGGAASNAVGYYPASQYGSGPLATGATEIDYGGEVVDTTAWPPMGSGAFANAGWQKAAYHSTIEYFPTTGGRTQAALTASQPSPNCFTINVQTAAAPWSEYFFFGGPGGTNC